MKKRGLKSRRGQAWVETVVYTLIGLSIIGIVLLVAMPKIGEMMDKATIEQTMTAMVELNQKVVITQATQGQTRKIDFRIKKGQLEINPEGENKIVFVLEGTNAELSEPGVEIPMGDIILLTEVNAEDDDKFDISLILDYSGRYDVKFDAKDDEKILTQASIPYQLLIKNMGQGVLDVTLV